MAGTVTARCVINKQNVKVCYPPTTITSGVESVVAGTNITVDDTDPRNPIVSSTGGGGGITGIAPVGNLLRVLTVDGGGNVVTVEASHIYEDALLIYGTIDGGGSQIGFTASNIALSNISSMGLTETSYTVSVNNAVLGGHSRFYLDGDDIYGTSFGVTSSVEFINTVSNGRYGSLKLWDEKAKLEVGSNVVGAAITMDVDEIYLKSTSIPLGGAGIIGIDTTGKLFTTTAGGGTTTNPLTIGTGLSGTSFDGSAAITIEIDSSVVTLTGSQALSNKTGLISQWTNDSGYLTSVTNISGNAATATALQTARAINGVSFDGTAAITVTAAAGTLTGTTLNSSVVTSSLTSVGALASGSLTTGFTAVGATIGGTGQSTVTTGDLLYGSASNTWSKLASGATAGMYLRNGGASTAPVWSTLILPNSATANGIVYATSTNTYGESSNFTFDGTTLKNGNASSLSTATPTTIDMGGTFADTIVSSKAKWKLYNDGTAINTYGIGISSGQLNFFKFTGGSYNWYFSNVEKMKLSETALTIADAISIAVGTSTGTKIGTATSQKIALWNKTPIAQPTTAITGATLTGGGGTTITATDTFGGYTLQQIAAALINTGILA